MSKLNPLERNTALALSSVVGLRMFGLFIIMPVFTVYAMRLPGATAGLVGLAIGIYGFAQALLQIPVGLASDRFGRHIVITLGLVVFVIGSLLAAYATNIEAIIVGRVLQGAGAVSGASQALAADHSRADNRNKVMGIIGISIGLAFILAVILSAPLAAIAGLKGLFLLTAILAVLAIVCLWWVVPKPSNGMTPEAAPWSTVLRMVITRRLAVLNLSIFMMHCMLTAAFVALPLVLSSRGGLATTQQWQLYLPVMLIAALVMGGVLRRVTSLAGSMHLIMLCAILLGIALWGLGFTGGGRLGLWLAAILFFSAFNLLEATLPALVSRMAPQHMRGAAMGAYATCQFLGAGVGGMLGGLLLGARGQTAVFVGAAALLLLWWPLLWWGRKAVIHAQGVSVG